MEQKKTLWIIAASGVFLLVVIGAALLLNSPSTSVPTTASITTIERPPVVASPETPIVVASMQTPLADQNFEGSALVEGADNGAKAAVPESNALAAAVAPTTTNIELRTEPEPVSNVTATSRAGAEALANTAASRPSSPARTNSAPKTAQAPRTTAPAAAPVQKSTASVSTASAGSASTKYWVQAASFTNKKSADSARLALDENKIPAEVFTYKDNKDTLFYRVRVGPYTTKSEAEYWKTRICKIDFFKNTQSYITEVKM